MPAAKYSSISSACDFITKGNHRYFHKALRLRQVSQNILILTTVHFTTNAAGVSVLTEKQVYYCITIFNVSILYINVSGFLCDRVYSIL